MNQYVISHVFAETTHVVAAPHGFVCVWSYPRRSYIFQVSSKSVHGCRSLLTIGFYNSLCYRTSRDTKAALTSETRWLYCVECPQYSIRLEALDYLWMDYLPAVYFQHSTRPSIMWRNSRWRLAACNWVMSALSAVLSTRVGRWRKYWEVTCTECTGQGMTELIPTIKIETRNPLDSYFGSEFPATLFIADVWRPEFARR